MTLPTTSPRSTPQSTSSSPRDSASAASPLSSSSSNKIITYLFNLLKTSAHHLCSRNGEKQEFNGGRTGDDIVNWILKRVGPPSTEVTCAQLKEKTDATKLAVAYFGETSAAQYSEVFLAVAGTASVSDKYQFFHINDKECASAFGASSSPALVLFRTFDERTLVYQGATWESGQVTQWLLASSVPTLITFSEDFIEPIFGQRKAALFLFRSEADSDKSFSKIFSEAASALKGEIIFVVSGVTDGIQQRLGEFIGVEESALPTIRILDPANDMKKFTFPAKAEGITVESIKEFVRDFKSGSLNPFLKSQDLPADNSEPVKTLVGKNFNEIVINNDNDVFVEFYAPWCGHCKKLAPIWDELAAELKDVKGITIAKMDSTANEVEGVSIKGYPTLKFYHRGQKNAPVDYDGGRELEGFRTWLNENSAAVKAHNSGKTDEL